MTRRERSRSLRFRLYFILMDVLTLIVVVNLVQAATGPLTQGATFVPDVWHEVAGTLGLLLPAVLMLAPSWRDEFAQACWQKAAAATVTGLFVAPLLILLLLAVLKASGTGDFGVRQAIADASAPVALGVFMMALVTLFTFTFQFHRWRGR